MGDFHESGGFWGSGKSKWGLSNGGLRPLSAICAQSSTIVRFCGLFGSLSEGNFRHKTTTIVGNRGQLWTSTLSPHLLSPHLDFSERCSPCFSTGKRLDLRQAPRFRETARESANVWFVLPTLLLTFPEEQRSPVFMSSQVLGPQGSIKNTTGQGPSIKDWVLTSRNQKDWVRWWSWQGLNGCFRQRFGIARADRCSWVVSGLGNLDHSSWSGGSQTNHFICLFVVQPERRCSTRLQLSIGADFWEVDLDSNFSIFGVRRFTEWPGPLHWIAFPVEILTKPPFHWIPPPFSLKSPFSSLKSASSDPLPKNWLQLSKAKQTNTAMLLLGAAVDSIASHPAAQGKDSNRHRHGPH